MEKNNIITIENLIEAGLNEYVNYNNQLVISYVKDLRLFRQPCHLKATTILVCISGEMDCSVNLTEYTIGKYSVIINFPENIIQINCVKDLKAFAIIVSSEYLHSLSLDILSRSHYYSHVVSSHEMFTLPREGIKHLAHYLSILKYSINTDADSRYGELIKYQASAFVTDVMLLYNKYRNDDDTDKSLKSSSRRYMILDRFIELVRVHHSNERELNFYAEKMCISTRYLSSVVKEASGRNATDWICEFVILEAKSLLMYSGKSIQEIAHRLNFPTQSAFGKYFKSQVGMSPTRFIENSKTIQ